MWVVRLPVEFSSLKVNCFAHQFVTGSQNGEKREVTLYKNFQSEKIPSRIILCGNGTAGVHTMVITCLE